MCNIFIQSTNLFNIQCLNCGFKFKLKILNYYQSFFRKSCHRCKLINVVRAIIQAAVWSIVKWIYEGVCCSQANRSAFVLFSELVCQINNQADANWVCLQRWEFFVHDAVVLFNRLPPNDCVGQHFSNYINQTNLSWTIVLADNNIAFCQKVFSTRPGHYSTRETMW